MAKTPTTKAAKAPPPRNFKAMRGDRVIAMAQARFGRSFASKDAAVAALSALPTAEQRALPKPGEAAPRPPKQMSALPTAEQRALPKPGEAAPKPPKKMSAWARNADAIRESRRPPSAQRLEEVARRNPELLRRYTRAAVSIDAKSPQQALVLLSKYGWNKRLQKNAGNAFGALRKHPPVPISAAAATPAPIAVAGKPAGAAPSIVRSLLKLTARSPMVGGIVLGVGLGAVALSAREALARDSEIARKPAVRAAVDAGTTALGIAYYGTWATSTAANAQTSWAVGNKLRGKAAAEPATSRLGKLVNGRAFTTMTRIALPILAARAVYNTAMGARESGIRGAAIGFADTMTAGRTSAAIDGSSKSGAAGAVDGLTWGLASRAGLVALRSQAPQTSRRPVTAAQVAPVTTFERTYRTGPKAGTTEIVRRAV